MNKEVFIVPGQFDGSGTFIIYSFGTSGNQYIGDDYNAMYIPMFNTTLAAQLSAIAASIASYATTKGYTVTATHTHIPGVSTTSLDGLMSAADKVLLNSIVASSAASYQTIVSQTGTAAPAVSGGFTPVNTLVGTPTMTWARTGAGVYTLTASAAVFNTSGKTGVFIGPLTNLNASVRGVVTSTTVVTFTTAVQSVAVLGLLGLTTTATDVLLDKTMIYIQNYA